AVLDNGNILISWYDDNNSVYVREFSVDASAANATGASTLITAGAIQGGPVGTAADIEALTGGGYAISWHVWNGSKYDSYGRIYDNTGSIVVETNNIIAANS
ncbi:hypothetical protein, partial [Kordiimonas laminariae]|uniref:hypothetical protein n=1 Tax=Kordiimonas laminariae TaxID=2917717 RepID=UPI001FF54851